MRSLALLRAALVLSALAAISGCNCTTEGGVLTYDPTSLALTEGATATFTVSFDQAPAQAVTVNLTSGDTKVVTVSPATLTIDSSNFNTPQTVTVTSVRDDDVADGSTTISLEAAGQTGSVAVTVDDTDVQALDVSAATLMVNEGATGTFTVKLNKKPAAATTVTLTSANVAGVTVAPATLTFSPDNFGTAQTVTVTGVQDNDLVDTVVAITVASMGVPSKTVTVTVADDDGQGLTVEPMSLSLTEGGMGTFTVRLNFAPAADTTVDIMSSSASATVDVASLTFTAANYATPQTVTVSAPQDSDTVDGTATITVASGDLTARMVSVTIDDDDMQGLTVTPATLSLTEGGANGTFSVRLTAQPMSDVVVALASSDTTAATVSAASLTFTSTNWNTAQMVNVVPVQDADLATENVTITASAPGLTPSTVAVTVTDDDTQSLVVSTPTLTVTEGSSGTFTVALAYAPTANVTVSIASSNTAAGTVSPATLTFSAANYAAPQTITVSAPQDANVVNENVTVTVSATGLTSATVAVSVTDDDAVNLTLTPTTLTVVEGSDAGVPFTVALTQQPTTNVTVTLTSSNTNAATVSPATLTFTPANYNTAQSVTVLGVQDTNVAAENVTVTAAATGITSRNVSVTVTDDDVQAIIASATSVPVNEGGTGSFTLRLAYNPQATVSVSVGSSNAGSATVSAGTVTFDSTNWSNPQTITLTGVEDVNLVNEAVIITASTPGLTPIIVSVPVTDNDTQSIVVSPSSLTVTEGAMGSFTVRLAFQPTANVTVAIATSNANAATSLPTSLTFTPANYATVQSVAVTGVQDANVQNETATLTLSSSNLSDVSVAVSVTDDDVLNISLTPTTFNLTEGGAAGTLSVVLTQQPAASVTVNLVSGTPTSVTVPASVTFTTANWNVAQTVTLTAIEDTNVANETVTVTASATGITSRTATVNVTDNDTQALQVTPTSLTVGEGTSTSNFTVRLAFNPQATVTVTVTSGNTASLTASPASLTFNATNWNVTQTVSLTGVEDVNLANETVQVAVATSVAPTVNVTATVNDNDIQAIVAAPSSLTVTEGATGNFGVSLAFQPAANVTVTVGSSNSNVATALPATLTFTPADYATPKPVTVTGVDDANLVTDNANITLTAGATTAAVPVTVTDSDTQNISLSTSSVSATEEGATGTFQVSLTNQPSGPVIVNVASGSPTKAGVSPTSITFNSSNWSTPVAVTVSGLADDDTANESVTITASSAGLTSRTVTASVTDNDTQAIVPSVVSPATLAVNEGGTNTFTVRLAFNPLASVTVGVSSSNGGSATVSPATLTFNASNWSTGQTVTVTGVQDVNLANETVTVTLTSGALSSTVTVNVTDNDTQAITLTGTPVSVNEGGSSLVGVRLAFQPAGNVTVTVSSADSATATVAPATINFTPGNYDQVQNVTVAGVQDVDLTNDSTTLTFSINGASPAVTATAGVTVNDDDAQSFIVNPTSVAVNEGGVTGSFNVRLAFAPTSDVTVTLTSSDPGAATATSTLTFTTSNWQLDQAVTITPVDDADTRNETLSVGLAATGIPNATVGVTVADNDVQALVVSPGSVTVVEEGQPQTFTVALAAEPNADVTVTITTEDPGAVSRTPATLTFRVDNYAAPQTVTLGGVADPDLVNESVNVTVSTSVAPTVTVPVTVTDDDVQDIIVSTGAVTVTEDTGPATFTVRLAFQPSSNVVVNIGSSNPAAATTTPTSLTFSPTDYGVVRTITVNGTSDLNQVATSAVVTVSSSGLPSKTVNVTVNDDDTQRVIVSSTGVSMLEGAGTSFTVRLAFEPLGGTETVTISSSTSNVATYSPTMPLVFTTADYAMDRTISLTGDTDADVLNEFTILTLDSDLTGTTDATVRVDVTDDDVQQIVRDLSSLTLTEGGQDGTVQVHLLQDPSGTVTVNITSSDPGAATATSSLTFDSSNYTTDQAVTISPVTDDDVRTEPVTITYAAAGIPSQTTAVTVNDDDTQAIVANPTTLNVNEEGTGTVAVSLAFRPTNDVTISAVSNDTSHITVSPATLTFTSSNYATPQSFTLTGVADANLDDNNGISVTLSNSVGTAGPEGSANQVITVNEIDNDVQAIIVTVDNPTPLSVQEGGPAASFRVHLAFPPRGGVDDVVTLSSGPVVMFNNASLTFTTSDFGTDQTVQVWTDDDADATTDSLTITLDVTAESPAATATQTLRVIDDEIAILGTNDYSTLTGGSTFTKRGNIAFGSTGYALTGHTGANAVARHDGREFGGLSAAVTIGDGAEGTEQSAIFDGTGFGLFSASSTGIRYTRVAEDFSSTLVPTVALVSGVDDFWPAWNGTGYGLFYRLPPPNNNLFFRSLNVNGTLGSAVQVTTATGAAHQHPNAHFINGGYTALYSTTTEVRCVRTSSTGVPSVNQPLSGMPASVPFVSSVSDGSRIHAAYIDPAAGLFVIRINPNTCTVEDRRRVRRSGNFLNIPHLAWNGVEFALSYDISGAPNQIGVVTFRADSVTQDYFPVEASSAGEKPSMTWLGDRWGLRITGETSVRVVTGSFTDGCGNGVQDMGETTIDCGGTCGSCLVSSFQFDNTPGDDIPADALANFFVSANAVASDYLYVGTTDGSQAICLSNALFYTQAYGAQRISGGSANAPFGTERYYVSSGDWFRSQNSPTSFFGGSCIAQNSMCVEFFFGNTAFIINPGATDDSEATTAFNGSLNGLLLRVGNSRQGACGFTSFFDENND